MRGRHTGKFEVRNPEDFETSYVPKCRLRFTFPEAGLAADPRTLARLSGPIGGCCLNGAFSWRCSGLTESTRIHNIHRQSKWLTYAGSTTARTVVANESSGQDMSGRLQPGTNTGTRSGGWARVKGFASRIWRNASQGQKCRTNLTSEYKLLKTSNLRFGGGGGSRTRVRNRCQQRDSMLSPFEGFAFGA
jgi:hypothetical protein